MKKNMLLGKDKNKFIQSNNLITYYSGMFENEKIIETKSCKKCSAKFEITDKDLEFYEKVSPVFQTSPNSLQSGEGKQGVKDLGNGKIKYLIPSPTLCPDCRQQRRLAFLNQVNLYKNKCLKCSKDIVSRFSMKSGKKNYCNECWSKEDWNQLEQGIDFDFSKSFFEQISYLIENTIYQNLIGSASNVPNNSVYTNHTSEIHNSYLVFEANKINNSMFSFGLKNSDDIVDSCFVGNSENCYECVDSYHMYNCYYCKDSFGCKFSYFLNNCQNCSYCIGCNNLNGKKYYIFNKEASKEEFEKLKKELSSHKNLKEFKKKYRKYFEKEIVKATNIVGSEDSSGNNIINSKNCNYSFDMLESEDCKYCANINYSQDLYDISSYGEESNRMYDSVSVGRYSSNILFSCVIGKGENLFYCIDTKKSKNCFGCVNLEEKEYCILNKQYSKEEYEKLVPKIITHMTSPLTSLQSGEEELQSHLSESERIGGGLKREFKDEVEWGEFFPIEISHFSYNETLAGEYFPLSKEEILANGYSFSDFENPIMKVKKIIPAKLLPENISEIPDDVLNRAIECEETGRPFQINKQELDFYRKHNLPIPRRHPNQRHLDRMKQRNPRKLYNRKCDKCEKDIKTTYSPEKLDIVYCEECYNKAIY